MALRVDKAMELFERPFAPIADFTEPQNKIVSRVRTTALQIARFTGIVVCSVIALLEAALIIPFAESARRDYARALWLHRWCRVARRILGLRVTYDGPLPKAGLLVSNHLSYLDIIVFSSLRPCVFVAKSEVARWPLFGWLAKAAGTIFVRRTQRCDSARATDEIRAALRNNLLVVIFPEGTSSDGRTVLPFRSALLEPAIQLQLQVTAAAVNYALQHGSVADEVCYWRDMTLVPHLWRLFAKLEIAVTITFADGVLHSDRKQLALNLQRTVASLKVQPLRGNP